MRYVHWPKKKQPSVCIYTPGEARLPAVRNQMMERDEFLMEIREHLEQAQQHYKTFYDRKHWEVDFEVGQWVWLRLLHQPIASLDIKGCGKLGPKFYGPFQILERVGDVAYKLKLPTGAKLHDVFHVELLKRFCGEPPEETVALPPIRHGRACLEPAEIAKRRARKGPPQIVNPLEGTGRGGGNLDGPGRIQEVVPGLVEDGELLSFELQIFSLL
jgi:hypothetical protein